MTALEVIRGAGETHVDDTVDDAILATLAAPVEQNQNNFKSEVTGSTAADGSEVKLMILEGDEAPIKVTADDLKGYLGSPVFRDERRLSGPDLEDLLPGARSDGGDDLLNDPVVDQEVLPESLACAMLHPARAQAGAVPAMARAVIAAW